MQNLLHSPLLYPVKLEKKTIFVLDETQLPFKEVYLEVNTLEDALFVLSEMKTRSFGQVLLFFYSAILFKEKSPSFLAEKFKKERPTFAFDLLAKIIESKLAKGRSIEEIVKFFILDFDKKRRERMKKLAKDLPSFANILTICNINGEFIYLYKEMKSLKKKAIFYISETRPYLQGSRLTFWELTKNKIPAKLICDNQAAFLMREKKINVVITGADRATIRRDIVNKIGTYSLACLAKYFGIPFYALVQYPQKIEIGKIPIEERPAEEVFMFLEKICYEKIPAIYPSFDLVEKDYITKVYEISGF